MASPSDYAIDILTANDIVANSALIRSLNAPNFTAGGNVDFTAR